MKKIKLFSNLYNKSDNTCIYIVLNTESWDRWEKENKLYLSGRTTHEHKRDRIRPNVVRFLRVRCWKWISKRLELFFGVFFLLPQSPDFLYTPRMSMYTVYGFVEKNNNKKILTNGTPSNVFRRRNVLLNWFLKQTKRTF